MLMIRGLRWRAKPGGRGYATSRRHRRRLRPRRPCRRNFQISIWRRLGQPTLGGKRRLTCAPVLGRVGVQGAAASSKRVAKAHSHRSGPGGNSLRLSPCGGALRDRRKHG